MLNPELKKELMLKLQGVIKEIKVECENDTEFYGNLEEVDILESIEYLQSINGINKLIEKCDKAVDVKSNGKYNKYNDIIKSLMNKDRYGTYDEILDNCKNNLNKAINKLILALDELLRFEQYNVGESSFYEEQLKLAQELKNS